MITTEGRSQMKTDVIYTVTTLRGSLYGGTRCVGFYHDVENAKHAVEENACDINECGYYHFAVIEKVTPGIYNFELDTLWYRWDSTKGYQPCEKPERFKRVICFGIG
jgi:hypothetical protein